MYISLKNTQTETAERNIVEIVRYCRYLKDVGQGGTQKKGLVTSYFQYRQQMKMHF